MVGVRRQALAAASVEELREAYRLARRYGREATVLCDEHWHIECEFGNRDRLDRLRRLRRMVTVGFGTGADTADQAAALIAAELRRRGQTTWWDGVQERVLPPTEEAATARP